MTMLGFCGVFGDRASDPRWARFAHSHVRSGRSVWRQDGAVLVANSAVTTPLDRAEKQPLLVADGRLAVAFQGRLDNRDDLIAALGGGRQWGDGMLAAAVAQWRGDAPKQLLGDFSLCVWDWHNRQLMLWRDPLGNESLYYSNLSDGSVAVATELRVLLSAPGVTGALDRTALGHLLATHRDGSCATVYGDIQAVPAGHVLTLKPFSDQEGPVSTRYWHFDLGKRLHLESDRAYVEQAAELLDQAVRCRLRGDRKVVSSLSGGLDSSMVTAWAAALEPCTSWPAYSCVPDGDDGVMTHPYGYGDEREKVGMIGRHIPNLDLRLVTSPLDFTMDPVKAFLATGGPVLTFPNLEWFAPLYQAMAADGAQLCLNGQFGNMGLSFDGMFAVNDFWPFDRGWQAGDPGPGALLPILSAYSRAKRTTVTSLLYGGMVRPRIPRWARDFHQRRIKRQAPWQEYCALSEEAAQDLGLYDLATSEAYDPYCFHGRNSRELRASIMLRMGQSAVAGMTYSRLLFGINGVAPLGDLRLLEFCLAIPSLQFMLSGQPRSLVRRLAADRLPPAIVRDTRYGLQDPQRLKRFARRLESWKADVERMKASSLASSLLDIPRLEQLIDTWPGSADYAYKSTMAHRLALPRALHLGQFILWSERGNG